MLGLLHGDFIQSRPFAVQRAALLVEVPALGLEFGGLLLNLFGLPPQRGSRFVALQLDFPAECLDSLPLLLEFGELLLEFGALCRECLLLLLLLGDPRVEPGFELLLPALQLPGLLVQRLLRVWRDASKA